MRNAAKAEINQSFANKTVNIEAYKENREMARDNASGIMYF